MLVRTAALFFIHGVNATLLFSQIHPSVVKLQGAREASGTSDHLSVPLKLKFNEKQDFSCWKDQKIETYQPEAYQPLKPFEESCWELRDGQGYTARYRVCIGNAIFFVGSNNMQTIIARSNRAGSNDKSPGVLREFFNSGSSLVEVSYKCNYSLDGITDVQLSGEGQIHKMIVESFAFCADPTTDVFLRHISRIPPLSIFVDEPGHPAFWEYTFTYPSTAIQQHTDPTGKTRNESYVLGQYSSESAGLFTVRFSDVDIDAGDPYMSTSLQYWLVDGDMCDRYNISRSVDVSYVCPLEWDELEINPKSGGWVPYKVEGIMEKQFFARIRQVDETRFCQYEIVVDATSLCIYKQFRPRYVAMDNPRTIRCYSN